MVAEPRPLHPARDPEVAGGPLLNTAQLVALLGEHDVVVSERQAQRMLASGIIPSRTLSDDPHARRRIVHKAEVLDWLEHGDLHRRARPVEPVLLSPDMLALAIRDGLLLLAQGLGASARRAS